MDAVSYPDDKVTRFINDSLVPLRVPYDAKPLSDDFNVKWTPTLVVVDATGKEHYRIVGFLPPEELVPSLLLGMAKTHFDLDQLTEALLILERIADEFPKSGSAPEAVYLRGVTGYKTTHTAEPLKAAWRKLDKEYPLSEWAKRAAPYRLL